MRRLEKHTALIKNDQSTHNRSLTYYRSFSSSVRMKRRLCQRQSGGKCPENRVTAKGAQTLPSGEVYTVSGSTIIYRQGKLRGWEDFALNTGLFSYPP